MKVYKYPINDALYAGKAVMVDAPGASYICHAGVDPSGDLCVWVLVSPGEWPTAKLRAAVYGTGQDIPDDLDMAHLTSYVSGPYVWHVFGDIDYGEAA
jgi:hypothetical protein